MLPNRFSLTLRAEEKLKREKQRTGLPPNVMARELFFSSVEKSRIDSDVCDRETRFGPMLLEKSVWLGECQTVIEKILEHLYPNQTPEEQARLWAYHIDREI